MITRRLFLRFSTIPLIGLFYGHLLGCSKDSNSNNTLSNSLLDNIGPLLPPDENSVMLPSGFSSRIIARSGFKPYVGSSYVWHSAPDGGATFKTEDSGWVYVSNSEVGNNLGGAGAIRFDRSGNIIDAYSILDNTNDNCAGGATSWNTWLSCEEYDNGTVWECDPYGKLKPVQRLALGVFAHEAAALDTLKNHIYMTEDKPDGCFYRFVPDMTVKGKHPNLAAGILEVAVVDAQTSSVSWLPIPDPSASSKPVRYQVRSSTKYNGGEGIVFSNGVVSFATKGDNRIWSYNTKSKRISISYDASTYQNPILSGIDNITLSREGELVVSEDSDTGGDMQIVTITKDNNLIPLVQLAGHNSSEITGPAFSPDGKRLYFSSQRGMSGKSSDGITYEVSGAFHR